MEQTITIDGMAVRVLQKGEGANVLVLHGWGGRIESFAPVIDALSEEYRVTALDFPGHGMSAPPPQPWSVTEYTALTQKLIEQLGIAPCHVIAHSFGGRVTILLSGEHPELFRRIILVDSAGVLPKRGPRYYCKIYTYKLAKKLAKRKRVASLLKAVGVDVQKRVASSGSADYKALSPNMKGTFVRVVNQNLRPYLKRIQSPTLLFWGKEDTDTPLYMGEIMEKEIPDAGLVAVEGAGHFSYLDAYPKFMATARYFLKQ